MACSPGPSQILSHNRGEKSGEGLGLKLCHGQEMVEWLSILPLLATDNKIGAWVVCFFAVSRGNEN